MKFLICEKQSGVGCDYMIACGMRYRIVEAKDIEEAVEMALYETDSEYYDEDWVDEDLHGFSSLIDPENAYGRSEIFVVPYDDNSVYVVDIEAEAADLLEARRVAKEKKVKEAELAEFERLAKKLGKSIK